MRAYQIIVSAFCLAAVGCSGSTQPGDPMMPSDPGSPSDPMNPSDPSNPTNPAAGVTLAGSYRTTSKVDLVTSGLLPPGVVQVRNTLGLLANCPGAALVQVIDSVSPGTIPGTYTTPATGCPTTTNIIRNALATQLSSLVAQLQYNGTPIVDTLGDLDQYITEAFKGFDVIEKITVAAPNAQMSTEVEQQVTEVVFDLFGTKTTAPLSATAQAAAYAKTAGSLAMRASADVADANLSFAAAPSLSIPVGELAMPFINSAIGAWTGSATSISGVLTTLIDCNAVGVKIHDQLAIVSVAVAEGLCTQGLTQLATQIENEIKAIVVEGSQVDTISAVLYDVSEAKPTADRIADRLAEGHVTWKVGAASMTAPLDGLRITQ